MTSFSELMVPLMDPETADTADAALITKNMDSYNGKHLDHFGKRPIT